MADDVSFTLKGLEPALAKMKEIEELPKKKATRFALRKAANLVRDRAQAGARQIDDPKTANSIADNVVVRFDSQYFRQRGDLKMSVGIRGGSTSKAKNANNPGGDTYYWRFKEFGTEKMRADPFMRPALQESIEPATDEFLRQFDKALARAIKRANEVADAPTDLHRLRG